MKIIKTLFAIFFLATMLMACETDSIDDQIGVEYEDSFSTEDANDNPLPPTGSTGKN